MSNYFVHNLNPIAFTLFGSDFHWYWLFYLLGFIFVFYGGLWLIHSGYSHLSESQFIKSIAFGWIFLFVGARAMYVLVYHPEYFANRPDMIWKIWSGGMSFHGAILGILLGLAISQKIYKISIFKVTDLISVFAPLGLFFGRIGNFINGELAGRVTDVPWAVIFPRLYDSNPRHPSQIYEAVLEGLILFIVQFVSRKNLQSTGRLSSQFLIGYGVTRFIVEFFRMPDEQLGLYFNFLSMGQILCAIMIIFGAIGLERYK